MDGMKNTPLKLLNLAFLLSGLSSCISQPAKPSSSSFEETTSDTSEETISDTSEETTSATSEDAHQLVASDAPFKKPVARDDDFVSQKVADLPYIYYQDEPLVVYMDLEDAILQVQTGVNVTKDGDNTVYSCASGAAYTVNPTAGKVILHNWDKANLFSSRYGAALGLIDEQYSAERVDDSSSVLHTADDVTLDLSDHGLEIPVYEGRPFLPFSVVDQLVFNPVYYSSVAWNGSGFYLVDLVNGAMSLYGYGTNSYRTEYYSGANSGATRPTYYATWCKNALLFNLDYFYGFRDERFVPFANSLSASILADLESTDLLTYERAVEKIINVVIGDGHTNSGNAGSSFSQGSFDSLWEESQRELDLGSARSACRDARSQAGKFANVITYSGNTAILPFDSFITSGVRVEQSNLATLANGNKDTFALLLWAMGEIKEHGGIDNVIFDITCNGGGDSNALVQMLGVMGREYTVCQYDPLTKANSELVYRIDTNLDGAFDANDSFEGQYDFYILTSPYSFSCGNMFPYVAKANDIATVIGQQSGGGACTVSFTVTPDGMPYRISGLARTGDLADPTKHDDLGVKVDADCQVALNHFYDDAYLSEFVNNLDN